MKLKPAITTPEDTWRCDFCTRLIALGERYFTNIDFLGEEANYGLIVICVPCAKLLAAASDEK